jgi:hypothetical protein
MFHDFFQGRDGFTTQGAVLISTDFSHPVEKARFLLYHSLREHLARAAHRVI